MAKNGNGKNDLKPGNLVIAQKFRLFCTFVLHLLMCSRVG